MIIHRQSPRQLTVGQLLPESQLNTCCPKDNELRLWQCLIDRQLFSFIILECRSDTVNNFLLYDSYMILVLWHWIMNRKDRKKVIYEVAVRKKSSISRLTYNFLLSLELLADWRIWSLLYYLLLSLREKGCPWKSITLDLWFLSCLLTTQTKNQR